MTRIASQTHNELLEYQLLHQVSRSFALTIPQLPTALRKQVAIAYLLCRIVDTIEDDAGLTLAQKHMHMDLFLAAVADRTSPEQFADGLCRVLSDQTPDGEKDLIRSTPRVVETFFTFTPHQRSAIQRCLKIMGEGMLEFQTAEDPRGLENIGRMDRYCYYVAGVVGEMLTDLFCDYSEAIAVHRESLLKLAPSFGQGLQMTNILKDFWEDRARGACWLPRDVFTAAGCDLNAVGVGYDRTAFGRGLTALIGITHGHLENALAFTLLIPPNETGIRKFCLWAIGMAVFTLRKIANNPDYSRSSDVKISRNTTRTIIFFSNATLRSNFLLQSLFDLSARGLPEPASNVCLT